MEPLIEYDDEANAVYLKVKEGEHNRTIEVESQRIYVDVDLEGDILGVEFLSLSIFQGWLARSLRFYY